MKSVSEGLLGDRRFDDALAMLRLNTEFFPNSPQIPTRMGEAFLAKGDTVNAIAIYRQAVQRDSTRFLARRRLRALGVSPN